MHLSVAIRTHNPRPEYLTRVLNALKIQTLPREDWELLFIDNRSDGILANEWDLSWHPASRHIREDALGSANAQLRATDEASGEILVFVDDDNLLGDDYLAECARISKEMPLLGVWGGQQIGEFEIPPPEWIKPYLSYLAVREFDFTRWSNVPNRLETVPFGAGMCVRVEVARIWSDQVRNNSDRKGLGRTGKSLGSCEDIDLAWTACDLGLGTGLFASLRVTHLIPKERLDVNYLAKVIEGTHRSAGALRRSRGVRPSAPPADFFRRCAALIRSGIQEYRLWKLPPETRMLERAMLRGGRS